MSLALVPVLMFFVVAFGLAVGLLTVGKLMGPSRQSEVKRMPYESGMDPVHDARRRFDIRFHLIAITFLVFDVELLFLYPWAVANKAENGLVQLGNRGLIFGEVMFFVALLTLGLVYVWRRGVFRWR